LPGAGHDAQLEDGVYSLTAQRRRRQVSWWRVVQWLVLTFIAVVNIIPIVLTFFASFKSNQDFFYNTYSLPKIWHLDNYTAAWNDANMGRFFLNSVVVTVGGVAINLLCATPLAYALARFRFRLNGPIFIFVVGGLIAPGQLIGVSLLQWVKSLHLFNTYFSLIFPYAAFGMPVAVLILSGFFRQLPRELEDAALIDGADEFTAFLRIMVPLVRPALATVIIFNGIGIWNDFFLPLVLAYTPDIQTLPLGIVLLFGAYSSEWGTIFAAVIIASVPVIIAYFFLTRQFIAGLSAGAVKG
jgi:raffinose/stachyose/melibiose transport system permease protein